jgi:ADP-ribose pyrophosphatase YjhB (NUDIX family)
MNRRVAVRGVVLDGKKVFAVRLKPYRGKIDGDADYWCVPGGGVDAGEPLVAALRRELIEELGIEPEIGNLLYVQQFIANDLEQLEFFFHITNAADFADIDLSNTTHGEEEIAEYGFVEPASMVFLPSFFQTEDVRAHIEQGAQPKLFDYIT